MRSWGGGLGWLLLAGLLGCRGGGQSAKAAPPPPTGAPATSPAAGDGCLPCHASQVARYAETAHARTSARADERSVLGSFAPGRNVLRTRNPALSFLMERRDGGLFHVSREDGRPERADRFDVVVGSGRKGQTYLYWRGEELYQLQVSWLREADAWMNGPGYTDGVLDLERKVMPRCLECHAERPLVPGDAAGYGLGCGNCHGDARAHAAWQRAHPGEKGGALPLNPARQERARALDGCALCHSGMRTSLTPPFSWRPGAPLEAHLGPPAPGRNVVDAHGNQVALLSQTKCFRGSPGLTCSTCHDVHRPQRALEEFAQVCVGCHAAPRHSDAAISAAPAAGCVECHMPNVPSGLVKLDTPAGVVAPRYRSHAIAIYPAGGALRR